MTYHLPGMHGRPACGVRRGVMSLEHDGVQETETGLNLGGVVARNIECRRCLDAMMFHPGSVTTIRWHHWLVAYYAGRPPVAQDGCIYGARLRR